MPHKVVNGTSGTGKLCIGNRVFPEFSRSGFQIQVWSMWVDKLLRSAGSASKFATIVSSIPVSALDAKAIMQIKGQTEGPLAPDDSSHFAEKGWSNLICLETMALKCMAMNFDHVF